VRQGRALEQKHRHISGAERLQQAIDRDLASSRRAPLEIVVNSVDKNKITGYLSVPKINSQTTASTGSM